MRLALATAQEQDLPPAQWPLGLLYASGWTILETINDHTFSSYLAALTARVRALGARILLYSYLRHYPQGHPYLEPLRTTLLKLLTRGEGVAAGQRRATLSRSLLAVNGPEQVAHNLLNLDPSVYLSSMGLTGALACGRFMEAMWEHLAATVATVQPVPGTEEISPLLRIFLMLSLDNSGAGLRFPERIAHLAEAVLAPWIGRGVDLPAWIRNLLFRYLGDPRLPHTAWECVQDRSQEVVRQYLAGEALEDFFMLLESMVVQDPMVDRARHQRRVLWDSCRRQGALIDAWLVIGPLLLPDAQRCLGTRARRYAVLASRTGARARHVALLLRIAGVTLVEWSHGGSYYLWRPAQTTGPQCYQSHYDYESLERDADFIGSRHENQRSDWRNDFLYQIKIMTGVRLAI